MSLRSKPLDDGQLAVLRWIGDGCPDGPLAVPANKNRAQVLANRGLVQSEGSRVHRPLAATRSWKAADSSGSSRSSPTCVGHNGGGERRVPCRSDLCGCRVIPNVNCDVHPYSRRSHGK